MYSAPASTRNETKRMNNNLLQAARVSLPNYCRRAVPYPEVYHLLYDPPPPATHLAHTQRVLKGTKEEQHSVDAV